MEGRRLGFGENPGICHAHFDRAGGQVFVHSAAAQSDCAGCRNDELGAHLLCLVEVFLSAVCLFINQLDQTASVAKVHKDDAALVSLLGDPAHHCHCFSNILFCQLGAPACPVQSFHRFCHSFYLSFLSVKIQYFQDAGRILCGWRKVSGISFSLFSYLRGFV